MNLCVFENGGPGSAPGLHMTRRRRIETIKIMTGTDKSLCICPFFEWNAPLLLSTQHAAGECIRQVKISHKIKIVKIVEFHYYICNQYEKCIQMSTNMTGIVS